MARAISYNELSRAKVQDKRSIVISECSKGGYTVAQQLEVEEGNKTTSVYLKGAFHIESIEGLYELRDAINMAIEKSEPASDSEEEFDDDEEWDK